jgi:hypothetical protein
LKKGISHKIDQMVTAHEAYYTLSQKTMPPINSKFINSKMLNGCQNNQGDKANRQRLLRLAILKDERYQKTKALIKSEGFCINKQYREMADYIMPPIPPPP